MQYDDLNLPRGGVTSYKELPPNKYGAAPPNAAPALRVAETYAEWYQRIRGLPAPVRIDRTNPGGVPPLTPPMPGKTSRLVNSGVRCG